MLKRSRLVRLLRYNRKTGLFWWRDTNAVAGCHNAAGYVVIGIDKKRYYAHRLAWLYVMGHWPSVIDHINRCPFDNRLSNLREANKSQNGQNRGAQKNNRSGLKGAYLLSNGKGYFSFVMHEGRRIYLGCFPDKEEAHLAFMNATRELHGEFAYGQEAV